MSIAETAVLAVELKLGTTGSFAGATSQLRNVEAAAIGAKARGLGVLESGMVRAKSAAESFGGALSHARNQISGVASSLGILAGVTGLIGVSAALSASIDKASEFAFAIEKLQGITGDSADSLARLIAVTDNYGISADRLAKVAAFTEKSLGQIGLQADGAAKFTKAYGFAITDATGKILPFHDILLRTADFYNSNASQSAKAALAAKLFGRSYGDLVPILKLGSKGIRDAEQAAADLGITLTATNVQDLVKFREATRDMDDALTGLKLQIGLALVPALTDLAKVTKSFVAENRDKIVSFFKDAAQFGRDLGGVVEHSVVPAIKGIAGAWNSIPPEVRDLLIKGVVADKIIKFTFGFSPITFAKDALTGSLKGLFGSIFQRGSSPANPMFVVPVGGSLGGATGAIAGSGLGKVAALASKVFLIGAAVGVFAELKGILDTQTAGNKAQETGNAAAVKDFTGGASLADLKRSLAGIDETIAASDRGIVNAFSLNIDGVKDSVMATRKSLVDAITVAEGKSAAMQVHAVDRAEAIASGKAEKIRAASAAAAMAVRRVEAAENRTTLNLKTVATKIDAAKAKASADTNSEKVGITAAIKAQKLAVTIPITNVVSVSNRDIIKTQTTFRKAGGFVAT